LYQEAWLRLQVEHGTIKRGSTIDLELLKRHVAKAKEAYGLTKNGARQAGTQAIADWKGTGSYYTRLAKEDRLIASEVTAPERISKDIAEMLPKKTLTKLAGRAAKRGVKMTFKVVGGVGIVTMAYMGYEEAEAAGAPVAARFAIGAIEAVNPLPWSTIEIKGKLEESADGLFHWTEAANWANNNGQKHGVDPSSMAYPGTHD
jgi:hypothetical protein